MRCPLDRAALEGVVDDDVSTSRREIAAWSMRSMRSDIAEELVDATVGRSAFFVTFFGIYWLNCGGNEAAAADDDDVVAAEDLAASSLASWRCRFSCMAVSILTFGRG